MDQFSLTNNSTSCVLGCRGEEDTASACRVLVSQGKDRHEHSYTIMWFAIYGESTTYCGGYIKNVSLGEYQVSEKTYWRRCPLIWDWKDK
jgi:hypothetical protein